MIDRDTLSAERLTLPLAERVYVQPLPMRFDLWAVNQAADIWGANCGPAAIAAITGLTLDQLRPHLYDFEQKRYTNPSLMWAVLRSIGARWRLVRLPGPEPSPWPRLGLARVQWEGPWTEPGVPMAARYRHTHWVGSSITLELGHQVFDVNCMSVGGWVPFAEWSAEVVPWLLRACEPKASGRWHLTHSIEVYDCARVCTGAAQ